MDAHNGGVAARNERPVVADLHYFDRDKDPDQYESEKSDLDLHISDTMDPDSHKSYANPHLWIWYVPSV